MLPGCECEGKGARKGARPAQRSLGCEAPLYAEHVGVHTKRGFSCHNPSPPHLGINPHAQHPKCMALDERAKDVPATAGGILFMNAICKRRGRTFPFGLSSEPTQLKKCSPLPGVMWHGKLFTCYTNTKHVVDGT